MVGPSPVTSNGTDTTEIEDEDTGEADEEHPLQAALEAVESPATV